MQIEGYRKEYDFKVDLEYGHQAEQELIEFFNAVQGFKVEVKADRYRNGRMAVECRHRPVGVWEPSGLAVTTAEWWAYRLAPGSFMLVSTARLKNYLKVHYKRLQQRHFAEASTCPAWGYLLMPDDVHDMMNDAQYD